MNATKPGTDPSRDIFNLANAAWDKGDLQRAFELFLQAAKIGDRGSQVDLGYFFDKGLHVKKDKEKALYWYYRAYKQGVASAANNIATIYRDEGDARKMLWWFRKAANMGDGDVLVELGKRYEDGLGVRKCRKKASAFYRRALMSANITEFAREEASKRLDALQRNE